MDTSKVLGFPKAYYQMTGDGVIESVAMSQDEGFELMRNGWHAHPQQARDAGIPIVECGSEKPAPRKPGRPRK